MSENQSLTTTQPQGSTSMLALIDRAARDPGVDVTKMEQLLAMSERIHDREAKAEYDTAMNAAQGEMRSISRDCHNPQTRSRYASYEAIDNAIRPIYTQHGFSMSFGSKSSPHPDMVIVTCRVAHRAGHAEPVELEMPADGKGARGNDVMTKTHARGSALSYAKRYIANLVWNLSFGEADDDGNAAGHTATRQTTQRHQPANKTPENPVSAPKQATEATRHWMLDNLHQFKDYELTAFFISKGWMKDGDLLVNLPLEHVPTNRAQLGELIREIEQFIERNAPTAEAAASDLPAFTEPFWDTVVTLPRKGSKRAEYLKNPDTIKSLYVATKSGDDFARERLFGIVGHWEPADWQDNTGKMRPPSKADVDCRAALDAFKEWHDEKEKQGQFPDLVP